MILFFIMCLVCIACMLVVTLRTISTQEKQEELWRAERKELIDRIQAGSFAELKQQEVRVIKAEKQEAAPVINYSHLE